MKIWGVAPSRRSTASTAAVPRHPKVFAPLKLCWFPTQETWPLHVSTWQIQGRQWIFIAQKTQVDKLEIDRRLVCRDSGETSPPHMPDKFLKHRLNMNLKKAAVFWRTLPCTWWLYVVVVCCGLVQLPVAPRNSQCPPSARFLRCNAAICRHGHPESKPGNCLGYPGIKTWWGCLKVRCQFDGWSMLIIDFPLWFPYLICHSGISPRWPMLTIWFVSWFGGMTYRTARKALFIFGGCFITPYPRQNGRVKSSVTRRAEMEAEDWNHQATDCHPIIVVSCWLTVHIPIFLVQFWFLNICCWNLFPVLPVTVQLSSCFSCRTKPTFSPRCEGQRLTSVSVFFRGQAWNSEKHDGKLKLLKWLKDAFKF